MNGFSRHIKCYKSKYSIKKVLQCMIYNEFSKKRELTTTVVPRNKPASKDSKISDNSEETKQRALLVALGVVYYMRLDSEYRKRFVEELEKEHFEVKFLTALTDEVLLTANIAYCM